MVCSPPGTILSISPGYDTPAGQSPQRIIPQWVNKKSAKHDFPGYDTLAGQSPRSIIPRWVNKKSAKHDFPGNDTPAGQSPGVSYPGGSIKNPPSMTSRGIIPQRVNLPGYHTPTSQFIFKLKIRITPQNLNQSRTDFHLTHWLVVQAESNNICRKSRWTVPLRNSFILYRLLPSRPHFEVSPVVLKLHA